MKRRASPTSRSAERGFTLLEVVIALAILAFALTTLLETQISSLANAGRARDITVASLLARSKMIDIEKELYDEGFTTGDTEENGDFGDEGHREITWKYKISEIELDIGSLSSLCGAAGDEKSMGCESMLSSFGGVFEGFISELGKSVRVVDLGVTWPNGKNTESMSVRALLTREDVGSQQQRNDMQNLSNQLSNTGQQQQTPGE